MKIRNPFKIPAFGDWLMLGGIYAVGSTVILFLYFPVAWLYRNHPELDMPPTLPLQIGLGVFTLVLLLACFDRGFSVKDMFKDWPTTTFFMKAVGFLQLTVFALAFLWFAFTYHDDGGILNTLKIYLLFLNIVCMILGFYFIYSYVLLLMVMTIRKIINRESKKDILILASWTVAMGMILIVLYVTKHPFT